MSVLGNSRLQIMIGFGILMFFLFDYVIANQFSLIAEEKGHDKKEYFWFCLGLSAGLW